VLEVYSDVATPSILRVRMSGDPGAKLERISWSLDGKSPQETPMLQVPEGDHEIYVTAIVEGAEFKYRGSSTRVIHEQVKVVPHKD
jgi:hypothetical protein